ncbi:DUF6708 domain-containing protein [Herbaspirillum huttiense]|uniref:DUF6708 domain-containing protein n=2 Tax=Herbaspirillum huttiense TaxID=863372 RepID=A0AAJ2HBP8_9BURK|nr:DUF6708 domain-containing protein [Herbaspirillum huttiense]MDR9836563.1 hypothetical protein [Herbaspirillum huttiense]
MSTSRFNPPNSLWYEDLPARAAMAEEEVSVMALQEDVIGVDQDKLDISRASSILRGGFIFTGMAVLLILCWFAPHVFTSIFTPPRSVLVITILTIQNLALAGYSLFLIWLDCRIPRDLPVRFDRRSGKIHVQDFSLSLNPFAHRKLLLKTFDWTDIEAELTKQAGFNGKVYMVRYALVLVVCRPGTTEVLERITLRGNDIATQGLESIWSYVRRYMEQGQSNLPTLHVRERRISLLNSLFFYMPYLAPGEEGRFYRSRMGAAELILAFLMIWFFWIWLPLGLCYYVAMRCAPEPSWPERMD